MGDTRDAIAGEIRAQFAVAGGGPPERIAAAEVFIDQNNTPSGIRVHNAIDAVKRATIDRYEIGDGMNVAIAVARINITKPYDLLVYMTETSTGTAEMQNAWRLYDMPEGTTPTDAFALIVERYGLPVTIGDATAKFHAIRSSPPGETFSTPTPGDVETYQLIMPMADGSADRQWCFAIARSNYLADVAKARG